MTTTNPATVPKTNIDLEQINMDNDDNSDYNVKWSILDKIINISKNQKTNTNTGVSTMNLTQGSQQTISGITDLQTIEMKLYASLDNNKLTAEQRSLIIDKINQISQTRMSMYQGISNMSSSYQQTLATTNNSLQEQMLAIDIVENDKPY